MANDKKQEAPKGLVVKNAELKEQYVAIGPYMILSKNGVKSAIYDGTNVLIVTYNDKTVVVHGSCFKGMELE